MLHVTNVLKRHPETQEAYVELSLDESGTRLAHLFCDGSVLIQIAGGPCVDLNNVQAMHLVNAILARSQASQNR